MLVAHGVTLFLCGLYECFRAWYASSGIACAALLIVCVWCWILALFTRWIYLLFT
jgi:hypothetical protein